MSALCCGIWWLTVNHSPYALSSWIFALWLYTPLSLLFQVSVSLVSFLRQLLCPLNYIGLPSLCFLLTLTSPPWHVGARTTPSTEYVDIQGVYGESKSYPLCLFLITFLVVPSILLLLFLVAAASLSLHLRESCVVIISLLSCSCQTWGECHISIVQLSQDMTPFIYLHRSLSGTFCPLGFVRSFHSVSPLVHHLPAHLIPCTKFSIGIQIIQFSKEKTKKQCSEMFSC